jgi:hypothetical protein
LVGLKDPNIDKSALYGFELPKGSWMVKMRIENDDLWQKVKSGEFKGIINRGVFCK